MKRHAFIRDSNHKSVIEPLSEQPGIEVIETFRPLDALVFNAELGAGWMEIKTAARNASIKRTQIEFMANTKMPVAFVKTPDEAVQFANTMVGLSDRQKANLGVFLETATRKGYHPAVIERVLNWDI